MESNPLTDLVLRFQELVAGVPELIQPLIVALAAAIPMIEGEGAAVIGVIGGVNPIVAAISAIVGNLLCVAGVVFLGDKVRAMITKRFQREKKVKPLSKGRQRFKRYLSKFGVPGASLLGPLALPTQFTAAALVSAGVPRRRVIFWQAIAITFWTVFVTLSMIGALHVIAN